MYDILVRLAYAFLPRTVVRAIADRVFPYKVNYIWSKNDLDIDVDEDDVSCCEYSLFSQNGEDGIIKYIFSKIGYRSKIFLEFGFGVIENNSLRLVLKEGFNGLYIDANKKTIDLFNNKINSFGVEGVKAVDCFLTIDNIEETILKGGLRGDIDLLSIDVDGNDYWFWKAIECISPRVVVMEYNASYGDSWSAAVPYDADFDRFEKHPSGFYHGASLLALEHLGREKGYELVYCDQNGVNAFFVRTDCNSGLRILSSKEAYRPHKNRLDQGLGSSEQLAIVKSMKNVDIP